MDGGHIEATEAIRASHECPKAPQVSSEYHALFISHAFIPLALIITFHFCFRPFFKKIHAKQAPNKLLDTITLCRDDTYV